MSPYHADAFVVVNRVKPHTEFTHSFESGLMKMTAIGMGKEFGATMYHRYFFRDGYAQTIEAVVDRITATRPLLFGVGIAEDGHGETSRVQVIPAEQLRAAEAEMLAEVKAMMPNLPFDDIDVLVIDEMGKDISGSGFDTKVVGRLSMPLLGPDPETPRIKRIVVCDLTDVSDGNADGVGIADFITDRLYRKIDRSALYINGWSSARSIALIDPDRGTAAWRWWNMIYSGERVVDGCADGVPSGRAAALTRDLAMVFLRISAEPPATS